ncbi:MAG: polysaccharide deacetylase family protein [Bacillota bacterium]|nr:polysaccharide deacetylase family protein [Bacillota bacterium]MDW7684223.1 polysaccharide deacetylase family protein [Bacillota bacterium]
MGNRFFFPKIKVPSILNKIAKYSSAQSKTAYLTFDDGPSSNTPAVLDILKEHNVVATFFVTGNDTQSGHSMYKRISAEGHQLGNHTYSHNYSSIYKSVKSFTEDFLRLERLLQSVTGVRTMIIRYPGGSNNTVSHRYGGTGLMPKIISEMSNRGYIHFDWNVDAADATNAIENKKLIVSNVLTQANEKNNVIVLLHDGEAQKATATALPEIIKGLRSQGFHFKVLTNNSLRIQFIKA